MPSARSRQHSRTASRERCRVGAAGARDAGPRDRPHRRRGRILSRGAAARWRQSGRLPSARRDRAAQRYARTGHSDARHGGAPRAGRCGAARQSRRGLSGRAPARARHRLLSPCTRDRAGPSAGARQSRRDADGDGPGRGRRARVSGRSSAQPALCRRARQLRQSAAQARQAGSGDRALSAGGRQCAGTRHGAYESQRRAPDDGAVV